MEYLGSFKYGQILQVIRKSPVYGLTITAFTFTGYRGNTLEFQAGKSTYSYRKSDGARLFAGALDEFLPWPPTTDELLHARSIVFQQGFTARLKDLMPGDFTYAEAVQIDEILRTAETRTKLSTGNTQNGQKVGK